MSYTVILDKSEDYRLVCNVFINNRNFDTIIDSGCSTTLIPEYVAVRADGKYLGKGGVVKVGGEEYATEIYVFSNVNFGGYIIDKLLARVGNFAGDLKRTILLGNNVLNNLLYQVDKTESTFRFNYKKWDRVSNYIHPFAILFDAKGNLLTPKELLTEEIKPISEITRLSIFT